MLGCLPITVANDQDPLPPKKVENIDMEAAASTGPSSANMAVPMARRCSQKGTDLLDKLLDTKISILKEAATLSRKMLPKIPVIMITATM